MVKEFPERIVPGTSEFKMFYADHIKRYMFTKPYIQNKKVLDIACGAGFGSDYMASNGAKKVMGGDISNEAINYVKTNYKRDNLEFKIIDATNLTALNEKFDVVISMETLEHLKEWRKFLEEVSAVLNDDGVFIVSTPLKKAEYPDGKPPNPFHVKEFYLDELKEALASYFTKVNLYGEKFTDERKEREKKYISEYMLEKHKSLIYKIGFRIVFMIPRNIKVLPYKIITAILPKETKKNISDKLYDRSGYLDFLLKKGYAYEVDDYEISENNIIDEAHVVIAVCKK